MTPARVSGGIHSHWKQLTKSTTSGFVEGFRQLEPLGAVKNVRHSKRGEFQLFETLVVPVLVLDLLTQGSRFLANRCHPVCAHPKMSASGSLCLTLTISALLVAKPF